jgi:hypothetical protein
LNRFEEVIFWTPMRCPHVLQLEPSTAPGYSDFCFRIDFFVSASPSLSKFEAKKRSVFSAPSPHASWDRGRIPWWQPTSMSAD